MDEVTHFPAGSPEANFFSQELLAFIFRAQSAGFDPGRAASVAICIGAYIAAAYFPPVHLGSAVDGLAQALRQKANQAVEEARADRDAGRLPPWPDIS